MAGRRTPYTARGITRVACFRCGGPGHTQWQICADARLFRVVCLDCDVALNRLVLRWMGFRDWRKKLAAYVAKVR